MRNKEEKDENFSFLFQKGWMKKRDEI